jgi:hypothetical protein
MQSYALRPNPDIRPGDLLAPIQSLASTECDGLQCLLAVGGSLCARQPGKSPVCHSFFLTYGLHLR